MRLAPVPNRPAHRACTSSRYSHRKVGRAVPVTPLRGVTGEPHTGDVPPRRQERQVISQYSDLPPRLEYIPEGTDDSFPARINQELKNSRTQKVCTNARYPQTNSSKFQQIPTAYCRRPLNPQSELRIDAPAAICFTLPPMSPSSHMSGRHPIRLMRSGVPRRASENQDALD